MVNPLREASLIIRDWREGIRKEKKNILISIAFLAFSLVFAYIFENYAMRKGEAVVSDIILDNIAPINLNFIFVYYWVIIIAILVLYPLIFRIKDLSRVTFHLSLLTLVRGCFITMTHLKTPVDAILIKAPWPLSLVFVQNDLFFSGHTAIPLIGFFVFKDSKIRWLFLASSIIMAATTLLMHRHYTIDVASAFFIAYGTFKLGEWILLKAQNWGQKKEFYSDRLY